MIDEQSYSAAVADELDLTSSAYAEDVTGEVDLTSAAYGEDVAEAINEQPTGEPDLRVCQYNIGHFNMGYERAPKSGETPTTSTVMISSAKTDGYPSSVNRNYATQLQRWQTRLAAIDADIYGLPEWNDYFGWLNGACKTTVEAGIFSGYSLSVGKSELNGWWQNALASKLAMSNAQDIDLGSTNGNMAYVRVATVTIKGKTVKVGVCHLNWNNPLGATTDPTYSTNAQSSYNSRQKEIKELVKLFDGEPYVILLGDFNTEGQVYSPTTSYDPSVRDYEGGLDEFDPFINGFTENGVTYEGGYTLANYDANGHRLLTSPATNSRPDLARPQYPYCYLDNIIVKGFTMSNVTVADDGTITDHCGLFADLTLITEGGEA